MPIKKPKKDWTAINSRIKNRKVKFKADERIFVPTFNEANQAKVVMRMLDSRDTDLPYATQATHFFNSTGGWFIENCPSSIDEKCPVCQDMYDNNYYETDNELYYERKKSTYYYTNVLIIEDKNNKENEGKVFLLKFGTKIMEKIDGAIDDEKLIWDEDSGVNFVFSAKKKGKMSNYDASYFSDAVTSLDEYGDAEEILSRRHDLAPFSDKGQYKSYDELKKHYIKVTGDSSSTATSKPKSRTRKVDDDDDDVEDEEVVDNVKEDVSDEDMYTESSDDDDAFFDDLEDDDDE